LVADGMVAVSSRECDGNQKWQDGPMTVQVVAGTIAVDGTITVDGTIVVDVLAPASIATFGVLWDVTVPALVLSLTDGKTIVSSN
jgi:hypothetical protein